jgi:dTDP-4-dehydrorhamnose reductase
MNIVLFGGSGQVGVELRRTLAPLGRLVVLGRAEADLARPETVRAVLRGHPADVVVNAAAHTAVDRAETEPDLARRINAESVGVMAEEVAARGGWLVHYSTDYVFAGTKEGGYREEDPTGPLNVYGSTKLAGERLVAASGCRHVIFRTSWVHAPHGTNFIATMLRLLAERDELEVVADQVGAPTSARLIAAVTAVAIARLTDPSRPTPPGGIYHLAADGATSWHGYAEFIATVARAAGARVRVAADGIRPIPSSSRPQAARRPANSRLDTGRLRGTFEVRLPPWQDDVREVVTTLAAATAATRGTARHPT